MTISDVQGDGHRYEKLMYGLCTTLIGSKYIQDCLEYVLLTYNSNSNINNKIMSDFFDSISLFGHLLCIDKYGHYTIDKLLKVCYQLNIIDLLKKFFKQIIIKNFSLLSKHSYPCRIVQNMLNNSNSIQLKTYVLTQLNTLFYPQHNQQQQQQQQQQQLQQHGHQYQHENAYASAIGALANTIHVQNSAGTDPRATATARQRLREAQNHRDDAQSVAISHQHLREQSFAQVQTPLTRKTVANSNSADASGNGDIDSKDNHDNSDGNDSNDGNGHCSQLLFDTINSHVGNYIVQEMIKTACNLNISYTVLYIFEFVSKYIHVFARNKFGCRVVQRCIMSPNVNHRTKSRLFASMFSSLPYLCNHEYGNYCIQKCIQHSNCEIQKLFVEQILFGTDIKVKNYADSKVYKGRYTMPRSLKESFVNYILNVQNPTTIINLSKLGFGKYSSMVCDTAFKHATYDQQARFVSYLTNPNIATKYNVLFGLINHEYGNFVIKNAILTLIHLHQNTINEKNHVINSGIIVTNEYAHDIQQREVHYSSLLDSMRQTLNDTFEFISKYHCHNRFSYAYNVIKLVNQE